MRGGVARRGCADTLRARGDRQIAPGPLRVVVLDRVEPLGRVNLRASLREEPRDVSDREAAREERRAWLEGGAVRESPGRERVEPEARNELGDHAGSRLIIGDRGQATAVSRVEPAGVGLHLVVANVVQRLHDPRADEVRGHRLTRGGVAVEDRRQRTVSRLPVIHRVDDDPARKHLGVKARELRQRDREYDDLAPLDRIECRRDRDAGRHDLGDEAYGFRIA